MKINHLAFPILQALALGGLALHIETRAATDVLDAIARVKERVGALDDGIVNFQVTVTNALSLLATYNALSNEINSATDTVTSTGVLSGEDSGTVVTALEDLTGDVTKTQSDADAQEPEIREVGYAGTVCSVLKALNGTTAAFYSAISSNGTFVLGAALSWKTLLAKTSKPVVADYTGQVQTLWATVGAGFNTSEALWCS